MSGSRPTWRSGLPYGWWKSADVWAAAWSCLAMVFGAIILYAWFGIISN